MNVSALHLMLTYQCIFACDHCFVWGHPAQRGTMTLAVIREILDQAQGVESVDTIYFEGGEPFLYYGVLLQGIEMVVARGLKAGIVSNAYWATEAEDALAWLRPLAGKISDLTLSTDAYHYGVRRSPQVVHAVEAADELGISTGVISVAAPGQPPRDGEGPVRYRGRAADKLAGQVPGHDPAAFTACPCEDLRHPGRVHIDPLGNVHICQGISLGNVFDVDLADLFGGYDPDEHPITSPLLAGGPLELAQRYGLALSDAYADACHLCYETRRALRPRFPYYLTPDQMYGV